MWRLASAVIGLVAVGFASGVCFQSMWGSSNRGQAVSDPGNQPSKDSFTSNQGIGVGASITIEEPVHVFRDIFQTGTDSSIARHRFLVHNSGSAPLHISRLKPDCSCTKAEISRDVIPAGESAHLNVSVDVKGRIGSVSQSVEVHSNDATVPTMKVSLKGWSRELFQNQPARIEFGRVPVGETISRQVSLKSNVGVPIEILAADRSRDDFTATVVPSGDPMSNNLEVALASNLPMGEYRAMVRLLTGHPGASEVLIPVRAHIGDGGPLMFGDIPDISGPTLTGETINLSSLRGSPTVIVFWASWCGFCKKELPNLVQLHKQYSDRGLNIVGINIDKESQAALDACQRLGIPWPNIHFAQNSEVATKNPISEKYQVSGVPALFLLDRDGRVVVDRAHKVTFESLIVDLLEPVPTTAAAIRPL